MREVRLYTRKMVSRLFVNKQLFWGSALITLDNNNDVETDL